MAVKRWQLAVTNNPQENRLRIKVQIPPCLPLELSGKETAESQQRKSWGLAEQAAAEDQSRGVEGRHDPSKNNQVQSAAFRK